jgi:RNA polymerase sigma factor (sigma-70 family)
MELNTRNESPERNRGAKQVALDEYALWADFKRGDVDAYAVIYRKYFFVLFSYGKKLNPDHELVKDCIQELFIKIWNNRDNLSETTAIKYYLFTALKRKLLDAMRRPTIGISTEADVAAEVAEIEDQPEEDISPRKESVTKALNRLSQHQQMILDMKFQKNLSNKEIADELGIGIQSVYNAVFKALRSIRKHLSTLTVIIIVISL